MTEKKKEVRKKDEDFPKILIGVPILSWTHEFATSFLEFWTDLVTYQQKGRKFHVGYKFIYRAPVHRAEEELADLAVASECTHLLLMDDDIYDVTAKDLFALLDADKDVVGGIMHASGFPHAMCAFRRFDTKTKVADQPIMKGPARLYEIPPVQRKGVQKVDLIPFCFTLIKTDVFKKLPKPWFNSDIQAPTDSWFADSVLDKKFDYYAHFDVWLNHRGVTRENQPLWVQIGLIAARKKEGQVIGLTPAEMRRHETYMTMKLQEAEKKMKHNVTSSVTFFEKKKGKKLASPIRKTESKDDTKKGGN